MPLILVVLMLCLAVGVPVAALLAGDRTRSIHRCAFAFGGLHCLAEVYKLSARFLEFSS